MTRQIRSFTHTLVAAAIALPGLALAQPSAPPMPPSPDAPPAGVTHILNARRVLDLTARQLVQLDSLERLQYAERRVVQERMRVQRDSMEQRRGELRGQSRDSIRTAMQARMEAMRPQMEQVRRRDSVSMAAAERILTEPQRQKLREMQAEERGRQRGLRESQMRGRQTPRGQMPRRPRPVDRTP